MSIEAGTNPDIVVAERGAGLGIWKSSAWAERAFCKACGSPIYYKVTAPGKYDGQYYMCAGGFDDWKGLELTREAYIDHKPPGFCFQTKADHITFTKAEFDDQLSDPTS
jgi:hypothetical protein